MILTTGFLVVSFDGASVGFLVGLSLGHVPGPGITFINAGVRQMNISQ